MEDIFKEKDKDLLKENQKFMLEIAGHMHIWDRKDQWLRDI